MTDTLAILEKVHTFYSVSFTQLIQYTTALLALVGVLVPSYLAFQQSRQTKREKAKLSAEIEMQTALARKALRDEIKADLVESEKKFSMLVETTNSDMETQFKKMSALVLGRTSHLQANSLYRDAIYAGALFDSCEAGIAYAEAGNEGNLIRVIGIASDSLPHLYSDAFEPDSEYVLEKKIAQFMEALEKINQSMRYSDDISRLNRLITAAKKRHAPQVDT